jgi:hypothetical protein
MQTKQFDGLYNLTSNFNLPIALEKHIYKVAERLSASDVQPYSGGNWKSEKIGEGWFFSLTGERTWRIVNEGNYSDVTVGTKAFSIATFLIALSEFSMYLYQKGVQGALMTEIVSLHENVMDLVQSVLSEDDYRAFCAVVD